MKFSRESNFVNHIMVEHDLDMIKIESWVNLHTVVNYKDAEAYDNWNFTSKQSYLDFTNIPNPNVEFLL